MANGMAKAMANGMAKTWPQEVDGKTMAPRPRPSHELQQVEEGSSRGFIRCEHCEALEAQLERVQLAKEDDAFNFAVDVARKNQEIGRLKRQLDEYLAESPDFKIAKGIYTYWVERCGKSKRTVYGPARKKAIITALRQHDEATIKRAIDGAALKPFVGPRGRQETNANGAKRFDDLTLILRDETTIERFAGYVE